MASGALFGNASGRSQSKNLVEFRAGKMYMKGKMVHPDKRKGLVYVYQSDDSLMHFCWKDRTSGNVEDVSKMLRHRACKFTKLAYHSECLIANTQNMVVFYRYGQRAVNGS